MGTLQEGYILNLRSSFTTVAGPILMTMMDEDPMPGILTRWTIHPFGEIVTYPSETSGTWWWTTE
jgi:hypothetical protein